MLIFTDADTVHSPDTVSASVAHMQSNRLDFFSIITKQELGTFAENVVIPMVHFLYFAYIPNTLIVNNPRSSLSAANGQFMCFRRSQRMTM